MTVVWLNPATTSFHNGTVTGGGGDADAVMRDSSDATYITFSPSEYALFTLDDLTLPSGAVLVYCQGAYRVKTGPGFGTYLEAVVDADGPAVTQKVLVNSGTPIGLGAATVPWPTDSGIDGATLRAGASLGPISDLIVYECSLKVLYFIKPVVTVGFPTGTITEDGSPTVIWSTVWDPDWKPPTASYHTKIFTDAQYGAGGFDPETSTATLDSGEVSDLPTTGYQYHAFTTPLASDTYRAYTKVSAFSDSPDVQWSAWSYSEFTLNTPVPGNPTISLLAEDSDGRVEATLTGTAGATTTTGLELQRSDDGGTTYQAVRTVENDDGTISGTSAVIYDFEASQGVVNTYRVRSLHLFASGGYSYSAWVTATVTPLQTDWWLKHPTDPAVSSVVTLRSFVTQGRAARASVQQPLGREDAVVVSDTRGPETGTITFRVDSDSTLDTIKSLADSTAPLLLQAEYGDHEPDRWVILGDEEVTRSIDKSWVDERDISYGWTEVARPAGALEEGS